MSWSVRGEEQEAGKTACTAGIISSSFGREWQHYITCLSKCIIEWVTSSTSALHCTLNNRKTDKFISTEILTIATGLIGKLQRDSGYRDSYNLKMWRCFFFFSWMCKTVPVRFKLYYPSKPFPGFGWIIFRSASLGMVLNENTEIKHCLHFQLDAIPLEPTWSFM